MNNFKNMKIEVNAEQPIEEIVAILENKGWSRRDGAYFADRIGSYLIATDCGIITWCSEWYVDVFWSKHETKTLAELKEM